MGIKVVLTGESSDETFLGYDIFKETNLLDRWIKEPMKLSEIAW